MWLMQALGFLLSALPVEDILRNLHSLITPYIQQLEKLADETVSIQIKKHTNIPKYTCQPVETSTCMLTVRKICSFHEKNLLYSHAIQQGWGGTDGLSAMGKGSP